MELLLCALYREVVMKVRRKNRIEIRLSDDELNHLNVAVSKAQPQNDSGRLARDIIDRTISNRVRLRCSDTPLRCGVPGGMSL